MKQIIIALIAAAALVGCDQQKAEIERTDNRRNVMPNVFFGSRKFYFQSQWDTMKLNLGVLVLFIIAGFCACVARVGRISR